jgi:hypothetical protein
MIFYPRRCVTYVNKDLQYLRMWPYSEPTIVTLRRRIKTHIIRYHTRNRMLTPQIKLTVKVFTGRRHLSSPAITNFNSQNPQKYKHDLTL